jgi:hypothetical protein
MHHPGGVDEEREESGDEEWDESDSVGVAKDG